MKPNKIGVFDSGIGGLFVLNELIKKYPNSQYYYYGDTKNMPFGSKSKEQLIIISKNIIDYFVSIKVDLIICACGTISTNILDFSNDYSIVPLIGITDPTINYINNSNYNNILVLSTINTDKSQYFKNHISKNITSIGLEKLASMIENNEDFDSYLNNVLPTDKYDAIILGCTHYPKADSYLKKRYNCDIIDMGKILTNSIELKSSIDPIIYLYFSKYSDNLKDNIKLIIGTKDVIICQNLPK